MPCRKKGEEDIIIELPDQTFLKPKKENLILTTAKKITEHTQSPLEFDPKLEEALDWVLASA